MSLSPEDVANIVFDTTRLKMGYDVAQVDAFLEEVQDTINKLQQELVEARNGEALSNVHNADTKSPVEVLALAQQALTAATSESERLVRDARARAASISSSIESERNQIETQIKRLEAVEIDYRNRLRNWLSVMLQDLGGEIEAGAQSTGPVNVITSSSENQ